MKIYIVQALQLKRVDKVHQLSGGDIFLRTLVGDLRNKIVPTVIYRININDGTLIDKISFDQEVDILSVLPDDKILTINYTLNRVQIWDISSNQFTDIFEFNPLRRVLSLSRLNSLLLRNGDVLFFLDMSFYLFDFMTRQIIVLPLFLNKYSYDNSLHAQIIYLQELRNGNILIANNNYLSIMEFPINQHFYDLQNLQNYDQISQSVINLPPDMLELIRGYL